MTYAVVLFWTEKKTGTQWFERHDREAFETAEARQEWLDAQPSNWRYPRKQNFMPLEDAIASRKEWLQGNPHV